MVFRGSLELGVMLGGHLVPKMEGKSVLRFFLKQSPWTLSRELCEGPSLLLSRASCFVSIVLIAKIKSLSAPSIDYRAHGSSFQNLGSMDFNQSPS